MIIATYALVASGLDWQYFLFTQIYVPRAVLYTADIAGFLLPLILLLTFFCSWLLWRQRKYLCCLRAIMYATLLGFTLSTFLKIFAGRVSPPHGHSGSTVAFIDNSSDFNFGFMQEQIFGGWPSSHTTIAFAIATSLAIIMPPRWYIRAMLFGTALFVGLGVSFGWHWLSEFVAGVLLGVPIGIVVGQHYKVKPERANFAAPEACGML